MGRGKLYKIGSDISKIREERQRRRKEGRAKRRTESREMQDRKMKGKRSGNEGA